MWWIIGIIGAICLGLWLLFVWSKMVQARELERDSILEKTADAWIKRRSKGQTIDQVSEALYRQYSVAESLDFSPIPFGDLTLASLAGKMPEDALRLGEIVYTISCHKGVYPWPRENQGPRGSAYQYDALTRICSKCQVLLVVAEATKQQVDPGLWQTMREWSALDKEIASTNAVHERALQKLLREPARPQMMLNASGVSPLVGLFGTRWLMPREEVSEIVPEQLDTSAPDGLSHFGKFWGRSATFSYHFKENLLTEIWVCINESSKGNFTRVQARLCEDLGPMSAASQSRQDELVSKGGLDGLEVEHWLRHYEDVGLTEMIQFRRVSPASNA